MATDPVESLLRVEGGLRLLDEHGTKKAPAEQPVRSFEEATEERHVFLCAWCETEITWRSALFAIRASSYVQVFPNPSGHMKVILTFRDARALRIRGAPTTDFTWFAGYAWSIAYCAACNTHLGWLFEAGDDSTPSSFFGLLKEGLIEREIRAS